MIENVQRNLIFDLGMHNALDTEYYLQKGFKVAALEANPILADKAAHKLIDQVNSNQLKIVRKAL